MILPMWEKTGFKDSEGNDLLIGDRIRHKTGIDGFIAISEGKAVWKIPNNLPEHELTLAECKELTVTHTDKRGKV